MSGYSRHHLLASGGILSIEPATLAGTLFHLGDYPGMHLSHDGSKRVHGEYIALRELDDRLLSALDQEEGAEYERELVTLQLRNGKEATAWTYVYLGNPGDDAVISSGDWRLG
jgi:gamma-glutamylcyclotransferase (GGCT)/AIG2-like uncharacterized protein YtfP